MGVAREIAVPFDEHKVQVSLDQWRKLIRSDLSHAIVVLIVRDIAQNGYGRRATPSTRKERHYGCKNGQNANAGPTASAA